jgi:hypothetical protein
MTAVLWQLQTMCIGCAPYMEIDTAGLDIYIQKYTYIAMNSEATAGSNGGCIAHQ